MEGRAGGADGRVGGGGCAGGGTEGGGRLGGGAGREPTGSGEVNTSGLRTTGGGGGAGGKPDARRGGGKVSFSRMALARVWISRSTMVTSRTAASCAS
jgi:hypothetical protein